MRYEIIDSERFASRLREPEAYATTYFRTFGKMVG